MEKICDVERKILRYLDSIEDEATTYRIAQELNLAWYTIMVNCYRLVAKKYMSSRVITGRYTKRTKIMHCIVFAGRKAIGKVK